LKTVSLIDQFSASCITYEHRVKEDWKDSTFLLWSYDLKLLFVRLVIFCSMCYFSMRFHNNLPSFLNVENFTWRNVTHSRFLSVTVPLDSFQVSIPWQLKMRPKFHSLQWNLFIIYFPWNLDKSSIKHANSSITYWNSVSFFNRSIPLTKNHFYSMKIQWNWKNQRNHWPSTTSSDDNPTKSSRNPPRQKLDPSSKIDQTTEKIR
jgi:hypothetical protein